MRIAALAVLVTALLAGCSGQACPDAQHRPDGTYVIPSPSPGVDMVGCEYQIGEGGRMESERDQD